MKRHRHVQAMAELVAKHVDAQPRPAARLLRSHLRCAAEERKGRVADELGVAELVGRARDTHLASLDADEGLGALCVGWADVVEEAIRLLESTRSRCERCGARLSPRRRVCGRCRCPVR
ncbi:MAG TPA: hypothetical protein VFA97_05675 [Gaiellaceae bacterium]|nr:hypothetical protein [Gaiellaceae bacterium]